MRLKANQGNPRKFSTGMLSKLFCFNFFIPDAGSFTIVGEGPMLLAVLRAVSPDPAKAPGGPVTGAIGQI
jgi:hypothetical protein